MGFKVGLMDADIYGPSQPKMLGLNNSKVEIKNKKIQPKKNRQFEHDVHGNVIPRT